ncbi:NAD(P)/FAD-dependent oxidoreductase [Gynurincola endophyticus]|jgi:D-amino-acid dehydrogenase|uniref:NAD(P)/FAD-dependent oxidoreductase n=1 Tax=Gynurincola endophyticus TaxID=2479004 RepID=UPI000F8CE77B|nr:FAD-dependent oxidoreductase [Gynurincola endophyticus]
MRKKITIVGGGIIGLCSAYYLHNDGYDVTVIERGDITDGTSFGNAGYVSPSHIHPLPSPGIIAKGLRWMMSSTSPFYIKPRANWDLVQWGLTFWKNANHDTMHRNSPHLDRLLKLSRELMNDVRDDIGNEFHMEEKGILNVYKSEALEKNEIRLAKEAADYGIETRILNAKELQDLEPEVEILARGAVWYPIDAHIHPGKFVMHLHKHLAAKGVEFVLNADVLNFETNGSKITSVITTKGKYPVEELVLSPGAWLPVLTKKLGIHLILQAGKGYSMTFEKPAVNLRHPAILVDGRVAMTPMGPDLRMGGTMEISGLDSPKLFKRARAIYDAAMTYYPNLPVTFPGTDKIWSGLRPLSPDGLPYIGKHSKYDNLVIAGGHAMIGVSMATGTGKIVNELIAGRPTSIDISAYNVERYK